MVQQPSALWTSQDCSRDTLVRTTNRVSSHQGAVPAMPPLQQQQATALLQQQQLQIKQQAAALQYQGQQLQQMQLQLQMIAGNQLLDMKNQVTPQQVSMCRSVCEAVASRPELLSCKEFDFLRDFIRDMCPACEDPSQRITADVLRSLDCDSMIKSSGTSPCAPQVQYPEPELAAHSFGSLQSDSSQGLSTTASRPSTPSSFSLDIGSIMSALESAPPSSVWPNTTPEVREVRPQHSEPVRRKSLTSAADLSAQMLRMEGADVIVEEEDDEKAKANVDPRKYKTRLCRNWMKEGKCSYEHTCCFAHGENELRNSAANLNVLSSLGYFSGKNDQDA